MRVDAGVNVNGEFELRLVFGCQEEVQSFRNWLRWNGDDSLERVGNDWRREDPLANAEDCKAVMAMIGEKLYGENNTLPEAVRRIPARVVPRLPVAPEPSTIDYNHPPSTEGAQGTLTTATARVGMRVHSALHTHVYGTPEVFVIEVLNDDGRTMGIRYEGRESIVDRGLTPINRMYPARGEIPMMALGEP